MIAKKNATFCEYVIFLGHVSSTKHAEPGELDPGGIGDRARAKASPVQRSYIRLMAIKALIMGLPHERVGALFGVNDDSVSYTRKVVSGSFRGFVNS